jgi:hypothetical protein
MPAFRFSGVGKKRGELGVKRGGVRHRFRERRGRRGCGSALWRWRRQLPVGLPEEEDSRVAERAGPPVSEGEAVGQARPEGGGKEVGHGWAGRGRKRGGLRLGRKPEMVGFKKKILSNFIWSLDFWQILEIRTRRF